MEFCLRFVSFPCKATAPSILSDGMVGHLSQTLDSVWRSAMHSLGVDSALCSWADFPHSVVDGGTVSFLQRLNLLWPWRRLKSSCLHWLWAFRAVFRRECRGFHAAATSNSLLWEAQPLLHLPKLLFATLCTFFARIVLTTAEDET